MKLHAVLLPILFGLPPSTSAQGSASGQAAPTLADASAKLGAQDFAGAAALLAKVVESEPKNVAAWRMYGIALQKGAEFDRAIAAYSKVLELVKEPPVVLYNLGACAARKGSPDAAFTWLARAKATRQVDMTQIEFDADLASLKADARWKSLLPTAAEFAAPFVEAVAIVHEFDGESANDQFGWIARSLGDVDGDGVADFVTSAPSRTIGGAVNAGRVYIYSSKGGRQLWSADGKAGDQLGIGIECAGDTNGDGVADVIASAPGGAYAKVFSGKDGAVLLTLKGEGSGEDFGRHVAGAGDVDDDGHADLIVGAPTSRADGNAGASSVNNAGRAYVFSGRDGRLLLTLTGANAGDAFGSTVAGCDDGEHTLLVVGAPGAGAGKTGRVFVYDSLTTKPKFVIDSDATGAALGAMFVAVCGDVDGDDFPDVYASDWSNNAKGPSTGRVYVHSGADGHRLLTLTGDGAGEGFGTSRSTAGDVDGDGHADFIVGAWQYAGAATSGGRAYLCSGSDGRRMRTITGRIPGECFGFDAVALGDVNGDGASDLLITSAWSGVHGFHSGRVFVLSGERSNGAPKSK